MNAVFNNILAWLETHNSPIVAIAISIGVLVLIALFILLVVLCFKIERVSGQPAYSAVKTIIIAIPPVIGSVCALLDFEINYKIILIITVAACIGVFIWNMLTYKTPYALMFTVMHIIFGFLAGLGVAAVVFMGIAFIAIYFFGGAVGGDGGASSPGGTPEMVVDVNTGESFYVRKELNGNLTVHGNGRDEIIKPLGGGRYIDIDYKGHEYVDFYDD